MALTEFGKAVRKARIEINETLLDVYKRQVWHTPV